MTTAERVVIGSAELWHGEGLDVLPRLDSVSAVVTDPPYGIRFMGKRWDYDVPSTELWALVLDRLLPGGHLLAFAGTRTQHRMAVRIEDAGFEIRDMLAWVYGSGFPKSLDVSKSIDKAAGAERQVVGSRKRQGKARVLKGGNYNGGYNQDETDQYEVTAPATDAAKQWHGWGTALKPSFEPITLARKSLGGTVAQNVQAHGTGGLNIDGCRIPGARPETTRGAGGANGRYGPINAQGRICDDGRGRWPANLIHDGSEEVLALFPDSQGQQGDLRATGRARPSSGRFGDMAPPTPHPARNDTGSAARFFYCAKAAASERGEGNDHPTVKPLALMRWLLTLVVPPDGLVLDPFLGSGSTGVAAIELGMRFIGIERDRKSFDIACARIEAAQRQGRLLLPPGASDQPPALSPIQAF